MDNYISLRYIKYFFITIFFLFAITLFLSLILENPDGALTRIGYWSERDFGWSKPQPIVNVKKNGLGVLDPKVLILGDSFSVRNIWQSRLTELRGIETQSFHYKDVGCIDNWLRWVEEKNYPNVQTIIIEMVEQNYIPLLKTLNTCNQFLTPKALEIKGHRIEQKLLNSGITFDIKYLFLASLNSLHVMLNDLRIVSGGVVNVPITSNKLFSNKKSKRLLYLLSDDTKKEWSNEEVVDGAKNLKKIQDRLEKQGLHFIVIVVPDKSSVYRKYMANKLDKYEFPDIFEALNIAGVNNVNLLTFFKYVSGEIVDLYLPNDNHLSMEGYKAMALEISNKAF